MLQPYVDTWYVRPDRYLYSKVYKDDGCVGAVWRSLARRDADGSIILVGHAGRITIEACLKWIRVVPESDRELLVYGR